MEVPMGESTMPSPSISTRRDLVYAAVNHVDTGRIPYVLFFQPEIARRLAEFYHVETIDRVIDNSIEWIGNTLSNKQLEDAGILRNGEYTDEWGVRWIGVGETRGQVKSHPLQSPTLEGYDFPPSLTDAVIARMKAQASSGQGRYLCAKLGALWEQATFLRGMEELLVDLLVNPGFVHDLLDRLTELHLSNIEVLERELSLDCIWLSDDYGTQRSLLMSPALWREFIKPRLRLICDAVHARGRHFALHSDGAIGEILPDIAEIGVDILNPVQPECVDVNLVKREYGSRLTIWGGYGSQRTLAFGTSGEILSEVREVCDTLGKGGGFILTPGLAIQNDVPIENAAAFIETAIECESGARRS
jgi:uroporphyrinogen decarboxylase